jgi:hypothetical protein
MVVHRSQARVVAAPGPRYGAPVTLTLRLAGSALTLADADQTSAEDEAIAILVTLAAGSPAALTLALHDCFHLDHRTETLWQRARAIAPLELAAMRRPAGAGTVVWLPAGRERQRVSLCQNPKRGSKRPWYSPRWARWRRCVESKACSR